MNFKFEYDHSHLSIILLHPLGIRSFIELEEVVESRLSLCEEGADIFEYDVFIFTGLTSNCRGLKVALTISNEGKYVTLGVEIPSPKELLSKVCLMK